MKYLIAITIILSVISGALLVIARQTRQEIKESRVREDLLFQEIKLLDYQINVLTAKVIGD